MYEKNLVDLDEVDTFCEFLHNLCRDNKQAVEASKVCGCFHCETLFKPENVSSFNTAGSILTVFCPFCGIDSVLPYIQETSDYIGWSKSFILEAMFDKYFGNQITKSANEHT